MAADLMTNYRTLERMMLEADERGNESFADQLRDLMDPIWYSLTDEQHEQLNARGFVSLSSLYPVTLRVMSEFLYDAASGGSSGEYTTRSEPITVSDWRKGAA